MEEIKEIVTLIGTLPDIAIYIATGFFAYKTIIVGSIYGVIKHVANIVYKIASARSHVEIVSLSDLGWKIGTGTDSPEGRKALQELFSLIRTRGSENRISYMHSYLHLDDIKHAIDRLKQQQ